MKSGGFNLRTSWLRGSPPSPPVVQLLKLVGNCVGNPQVPSLKPWSVEPEPIRLFGYRFPPWRNEYEITMKLHEVGEYVVVLVIPRMIFSQQIVQHIFFSGYSICDGKNIPRIPSVQVNVNMTNCAALRRSWAFLQRSSFFRPPFFWWMRRWGRGWSPVGP